MNILFFTLYVTDTSIHRGVGVLSGTISVVAYGVSPLVQIDVTNW